MKIYSINNFSLNHYKLNKSLNPTNLTQSSASTSPDFQLAGVPKAYISFGSDYDGQLPENPQSGATSPINNTSADKSHSRIQSLTLPASTNLSKDEKRKIISLYMKYREIKNDFDNEDPNRPLYKIRTDSKIDQISQERGHYGYFSNKFKPYRLKKRERLEIENDEYKKYCDERTLYNTVRNNLHYFESVINTDEIDIYEKAKYILTKNYSMDNVLAGYSAQKNNFRKLVIDPIQRENIMGTNENIPPAILLYGPTGCGKSKMAQTVADEANCKLVTLDPNTSARKFTGALKFLLDEARDYYAEQKQIIDAKYDSDAYKYGNIDKKAEYSASLKSPRTIIVINEIDKYFNPPTKTNSEEEKTQASEIADMNKTFLKGVLDHCSEKPDSSDSSGSAGVTFIFTTNYPSRVDSEITLRNGKCLRMPFYMPDDSERKDILKFYLENYSNPAIQKAITEEGKDRQTIDIEQVPYDAYVSVTASDPQKGAIAGAGIEKAVNQATTNYLNNKNQYLNLQLGQMLAGAQYRVSPDNLNEYIKELEDMGMIYKEIDEKEEYELLKDLDNFEMITDEQKVRYNYLKEIYEINN